MAESTDSATAAEPGGERDGGAGAGHAPADDASLAAIVCDVRSLWTETAAQVRGVGELALLELELAVGSFQRILVAGLVLAGLSLSTCLCLLGVLAAVLIESGVSPPLALLAVAVVNLAAACILYVFIRSLARDIQFRSLRRYLSEQRREQTSEQTQHAA